MKRCGFIVVIVLMAVMGACKRTESETATATAGDTAGTTAASAPDTSSTTASSVPAGDLNFATIASMANLYEIESGKLAEQKATGNAYKEFARTMVRQHTEIGENYAPIAQQQGLPAPTTLADISPEANFKTLYDTLSSTAAGPAFDALYKQQMIATHSSAKSLFETEASTGQDPQLKRFAAQWLPTVEHHLQMANDLPAAK